jgi:hypothetical protein
MEGSGGASGDPRTPMKTSSASALDDGSPAVPASSNKRRAFTTLADGIIIADHEEIICEPCGSSSKDRISGSATNAPHPPL